MKNTLKRFLALAMALMMVFALAACGGAKESATPTSSGDASGAEMKNYSWKITLEENLTDPAGMFAESFAKVLSEKSGGKIALQIFPVGQLGGDADLLEVCQTGTVEFGINSPGVVSTIIPELNIFNFHFLLPADQKKVDAFMNSDSKALAAINEKFENHGLHVLTWASQPANVWAANKPLVTPEDFEGVRVRTQAAPSISKNYELYGGSPVFVSYSELYSALQLGMADAHPNPIASFLANSTYEVQTHCTLSYPDYYINELHVNKAFFESLPADVQTIVQEAAIECLELYYARRDQNTLDSMAELEEKGMIFVEMTEEQRDVFRQIALDNREMFYEYIGDDGVEILNTMSAELEAFN